MVVTAFILPRNPLTHTCTHAQSGDIIGKALSPLLRRTAFTEAIVDKQVRLGVCARARARARVCAGARAPPP